MEEVCLSNETNKTNKKEKKVLSRHGTNKATMYERTCQNMRLTWQSCTKELVKAWD